MILNFLYKFCGCFQIPNIFYQTLTLLSKQTQSITVKKFLILLNVNNVGIYQFKIKFKGRYNVLRTKLIIYAEQI